MGTTSTKVSVNDKLTETDLQLITFIEQHYQLTGEILSADKATSEFGIDTVTYATCFGKKATRAALVERGIVFERLGNDWTSKSLTPIQLIVANTLLDLTDTRSQKKKLQDLEVSTQTYNIWLKDPVFKTYIHTRAQQLIGDSAHEVDTALLDRVRSGDLKAISYINEMTGRFVPQKSGANVADVQNLIVKIIEIIDFHVKSTDDKLAVAQALKALIANRNAAAALIGEEETIVVPRIAISRKVDDDGTIVEPKELEF